MFVPRYSKAVPNFAKNLLNGMIISNNGGDANNDLDIAAGACTDSTNSVTMTLTSSITKRLDAAWVAGSGNGGLDTGAKAASTTYHIYVIFNGTTTDVIFSTNASNPLMPSGYSYFRRIGSVMTNGSSNWMQFIQDHDTFKYTTTPVSYSQDNIAPFGDNVAISLGSVPTGIRVKVIGHLWVGPKNNQSSAFAWIGNAGQSKPAADSTNVGANGERTDIMARAGHTSGEASALWHQAGSWFELTTNTSAQLVMSIATSIGGNVDIRLRVFGYIDSRGK